MFIAGKETETAVVRVSEPREDVMVARAFAERVIENPGDDVLRDDGGEGAAVCFRMKLLLLSAPDLTRLVRHRLTTRMPARLRHL
jgi:hypothetical protein